MEIRFLLPMHGNLIYNVGMGKDWSKGKVFVPRIPCKICGALFYCAPSQVKRGGKYCSHKCRGISIRKKIHTRTCVKCRGPFSFTFDPEKTPGKICPKCSTSNRSKCKMHSCLFCAKISKNKFCNRDCYNKYRKMNLKPRNLRPNTVCLMCGNKFYAAPGRIRDGFGKFCSMPCRSKGPRGGRGRSGIREDIRMYVRSSWEANYARYLNFLVEKKKILRWEYEVDTFEFTGIKRGTRFYTPDFKVFENDGSIIYHEVKGYMDQRSKTKLKRMAKYYPQTKIILIQGRELKEIKNKVGRLLNWESHGNDKLQNWDKYLEGAGTPETQIGIR